MRIYKTRADFTALNTLGNPGVFPGTVCTITDEASNPMYAFQDHTWTGVVTATTDPSTGKIELSSGTTLLPSSMVNIGQNYTKVLLPLNQSGGPSVLPTDYSGNGVVCAIGAGNTDPWGNQGFFTTPVSAGAAGLQIPASVVALNMAESSFIFAATVVKPITGGLETLASTNNNAGSALGFTLYAGATGLIGPRFYVASGTAFAAKYGSAVVGGGAVGATTNTAGYAIAATTITLASAGLGIIQAGDKITFGNDPNQYTVSAGSANVAAGGTVVIPAPGLVQAIPAAATKITIADGPRVHRVMMAWDAPTKTVYQYVDGVLDFSMVSDKAFAADESITLELRLSTVTSGQTYAAQFAGVEFLSFPSSGLPKNMPELAVADNLHRRTGLIGEPVFL